VNNIFAATICYFVPEPRSGDMFVEDMFVEDMFVGNMFVDLIVFFS
jgi:hypothetical protein